MEFILLRDALTDNLMIIRKSMISSVEETTHDNKSVRKVCYTDGKTCEYVQNSLMDIFNALKET